MNTAPLLFALDGAVPLGADIAAALRTTLAAHEVRNFDGGEHKLRPLVSVRRREVTVIASLDGDEELSANDKLCRLLFFIGALHEASAASVTAVVPYLCYSRKDRQTKARDPVTTRYVAQLFEAVGTDRLVTVDVHNLAAFQNASRGATEHLEATELFVDHVAGAILPRVGDRPLVVVSPDIGGAKRARRFQERVAASLGIDVDLAFVDKVRSRGVISGSTEIHGTVQGAVALVYDDLISSGGTMLRVAEQLRSNGAHEVHVLATHALFSPAAEALFRTDSIRSVIVTDSVSSGRLPAEVTGDRLVVRSLAGLLAEAIRRMHEGGSLTELLHLDE